MPIIQQTTEQTESDLEAKIHATIARVFPWLGPEAISHQTKFSFTFGRARVEVDGLTASRHLARTDILLKHGANSLAVLELKRPGQPLTPPDVSQGLSYARILHPRPPLVVVTNGMDTKIYETHSGALWNPQSLGGEAVEALFAAAGTVAASDLKNALDVLLGPGSQVWVEAVRSTSRERIAEMTGDLDQSNLPFAKDFLIPRSATIEALDAVRCFSLVFVEGPPLIGKSNILRQMVQETETSETVACLYLEVESGGSGVLQQLSNLLADSLGWQVSRDEVRQWLRKLSIAGGPSLVVLLDGVGTDRDEIYRELQELSSGFGVKLRMVLAVDDTVADLLVRSTNSHKASGIGRQARRIRVDSLSDEEFGKAQDLMWGWKIALLKGGEVAEEYRSPWVLRAAIAIALPASPEALPEGAAIMMPSLLGLELIRHARERFKHETDLRRQFRKIALALLSDITSEHRNADSVLFSLLGFAASRDAIEVQLDRQDIDSLQEQGILRQMLDTSGESLFLLRIPELVAVELSNELANQMIARIGKGENPAEWLAKTSRLLPLGDIIGAQAIIDAASRCDGFSVDILEWFLNHPPTIETMKTGASGLAVLPEIGQVTFEFKEDGVVEIVGNGQRVSVTLDEDDFGSLVALENWLILSHIARHAIEMSSKSGEFSGRVDPAILLEVGSSPHVLRRVGSTGYSHHLVHTIKGYGEIVCEEAGFIEPILLAIYEFLSRQGAQAEDWVKATVSSNSLPLLHRVGMVLRLLETSTNPELAQWSTRTWRDLIEPAFAAFPPFKHS
jgi:hypothetical protein